MSSTEPENSDGNDESTRQRGTLGSDLLDHLTPEQLKARDAILRGANTKEAAEEIGKTRQTVSRWRNHDPDFKAALNRGKRDDTERLRQRRQRVKEKALAQLEEQVERGVQEAIKLAVTEIEVEPPEPPLRTTAASVAARDQVMRALREDQARRHDAQAVLQRIVGYVERERLTEKLRELSEGLDDLERSRKLQAAAWLLDETTERTDFDGAAPELVRLYFHTMLGLDDQSEKGAAPHSAGEEHRRRDYSADKGPGPEGRKEIREMFGLDEPSDGERE